jgi:hypothetical protein
MLEVIEMARVGKDYIRGGKYSIVSEHDVQEVLDLATDPDGPETHVKFGDFMVKVSSERFVHFNKSTKCQMCGRKGNVMRLVHDGNPVPHFNLYSVSPSGQAVLMTKGSKHHPAGHMTTCEPCMNSWYRRNEARIKEETRCNS